MLELLLAQTVSLDWKMWALVATVGGMLFTSGGWVTMLRSAPTNDYVHNAIDAKTAKLVDQGICNERFDRLKESIDRVENTVNDIRNNMPGGKK